MRDYLKGFIQEFSGLAGAVFLSWLIGSGLVQLLNHFGI